MQPDFRIEVYAVGERNEVIEKCRQSIMSNGGDILDFKMFSDLLINFIIDIPKKNLSELNSELESFNWNTEWELYRNDNLSLLRGSMSVTFVSGMGDKKDVILAVPG